MSDYIPKDPIGPTGMGPGVTPGADRYGYDRYGNTQFEPADDTGKGPYILLGLLVAIGLIGGLLYFNGSPKGGESVAQAPNRPAIERTTTPSPAPALPSATPAPSSMPSPAASPAAKTPSDSGTSQQ